MSPITITSLVTVLLALGSVVALAQDHPPHRAPPPEALAACTQHTAGAACTFQGHEGERVDGTCRAPEGLPLACVPPHHDHDCGHGHHGPPPGAIQACHDIAVGDACVVDTPHGTIEGTCRQTPEGNACIPAHHHHHHER